MDLSFRVCWPLVCNYVRDHIKTCCISYRECDAPVKHIYHRSTTHTGIIVYVECGEGHFAEVTVNATALWQYLPREQQELHQKTGGEITIAATV